MPRFMLAAKICAMRRADAGRRLMPRRVRDLLSDGYVYLRDIFRYFCWRRETFGFHFIFLLLMRRD